jgi:hypothetical protein
MTKVIEKKLGREKALGIVNEKNPRSRIYVDPRQRSRTYMGTIIHEKLHLLFPKWSETKVLRIEKELRDVLWEHNYRKVQL